MRYFTKEWYQRMQNGCLHVLLLPINKADNFSEEYFQKVYKRQEKQQIDMEKSCFEMWNHEKIYENYKGKTLKKRLKWKEEYLQNDDEFKLAIDESKKLFKDVYNIVLKNLENNLPKEIKSQVADIRLLALNRCTPKVKTIITKFCENNNKFVHESIEKYYEESEQSFVNNSTEIVKKLNFHDGEIYSFEVKENDFIITISDLDSVSGYSEITFKKYKLIGEDANIQNATWLYEEIYKREYGYEFHVLLTKEDTLIEFGIIAEDIVSTKKLYEDVY